MSENHTDEPVGEVYDPARDIDLNDPHLIRVEEKRPTWMDKFGLAFGQLVLALILFLVAFGILFANEERTVLETWRLNEGNRLVVQLQSDKPDSDNNGQLIHLTGRARTREILSDEMFFMSVKAIKLKRIMEMYQWQETKVKKGEETYEKKWIDRPIDSARFKQVQGHNNPKIEFNSNEYMSHKVMIGGFNLSEQLVLKLDNYEDYKLTKADYARINPEMQGFQLVKGMFYKGQDIENPEVGDLRVRYQLVKSGQLVSVIGLQNVDSLQPYSTDYSIIKVLHLGRVDPDTMLRREVDARDVRVIWWMRFAGWIGMLASIWILLNSFRVLHYMFPGLARLLGYNNFELSFFFSLALALLTVAFSWVNYQPAFGVGLIILSCSLIVSTALLSKMQDKKKKRAMAKKMKQSKKANKGKAAKQKQLKKAKKAKRGKKGKGEELADVEQVAEEDEDEIIPATVKFLKGAPEDK